MEKVKVIFDNIEGTCACNGNRSHIYWQRDYTPKFKGAKQVALAETLRLLRKQEKECIETFEGAVAVLMSEEIDSTSHAVLAKEIQQDVHVISAGYKGNRRLIQEIKCLNKHKNKQRS